MFSIGLAISADKSISKYVNIENKIKKIKGFMNIPGNIIKAEIKVNLKNLGVNFGIIDLVNIGEMNGNDIIQRALNLVQDPAM